MRTTSLSSYRLASVYGGMGKRTSLLCFMGLLMVWGGLVSCSTVAGPGKADLATVSDETENRKRARIRLELAVNYFNEGKTSIALDELKQSIAADSGLYEAFNLRALVYMRLSEADLAEDSFRRALALSPNAATVRHNYGFMLCNQGRTNEAVTQFSAALAQPAYLDRSKTWMVQGLCQATAGRPHDAEASLLRAYQIDPDNPVVAYNLALQFFKQHQYPEAQRYLQRLNSSPLANAESLWLGAKLARATGNSQGVDTASAALRSRFADTRERLMLDRGAFDE